ncbi:3-oxoacyl-ACP synthase [Actinotalea sp. M2MS4P-6]|uniref:3-oxoacyl-ACP synthase n=1 Tax=Actinotalea sp. M2MS4P-6 TaxID=2983762 RepID=UPI0021E3685E|nr:3-oxoacyl-ACP synthase [Actinotalea sp. M2MS4P-6]MCV2394739.1 3-oxoacyl-ACP synthase [Actinotalea sp. M2MS4P-6]
MSTQENVGILGYGLYLPEPVMTAREISEATGGVWSEDAVVDKLGIVRKPVPGPGDGTQEMGARAALDALERTGLDPLEIDVILCIGEEWKEYGLTTSALYIQDRIGATNAWGIDVANRCCTTLTALKMAKDMLLADDDIDTVLVAGGYRNGDFVDYTDTTASMFFNLGAGGGAFLVRKGMDENLILGTHILSDGSLAHTAGVQIGGTAEPFTPDNVAEGYRSLRLMDPVRMKERLNATSLPNWYTCIDESLRKSGGLKRADIDYLGVLHFKRSQHLAMLADLGLTEDDTTYLEDYGHIGQVDQMLTLHLGLAAGKITDGSLVTLIAAGIGYVWASTCIRWGKAK